MIRSFFALAVASALSLGSVAHAQAAHPLSLANASTGFRAGADPQGGSQLQGSAKWILGAIVLGLVIWGAIELLGNDEEAFPTSP